MISVFSTLKSAHVARQPGRLTHYGKRGMVGAAAGLLALAFLTVGSVGVVSTLSATPAQANACNSSCLSRYNQCRISTNNSPSCGRQFQACVRRCIRR